MNKPIVSVVVPVYNGEKIVEKAMESIRNQSLKEIEIIVVDDGSTDGTAVLLDRIAAEDTRVRVIHQENQGSYNARTNGIGVSTGKYFTSVDADDAIEPTMLEEMVALAEREILDLVECDLSVDTDNSGKVEIYKGVEDTRRYYIEPVLICGQGFSCVCGKLYRREIVFDDVRKEHILKQRVTLFEDMLFNYQVLDQIASYGRIHKPLYNYYINEGSSVRNFKSQNIEGFDFVLKIRQKLAKNYGLKASDARLLLWTLRNAKNMITLASYARQESIKINVEHVEAMLNLFLVRSAWDVSNKHDLLFSVRAFFAMAYSLPAIFIVLFIKFAKKVV